MGFIRPAEHAFLRRVADWAGRVTARNQWQLTDFLTAREQQLATHAAKGAGLTVADWGGYEEAERRRLLLMPDTWNPTAEDFLVSTLQVTADGPLTHGALLGALLASGLERKKVGDLAVLANRALIAVDSSLTAHIISELRQAGRTSVQAHLAEELVQWPQVVYQPLTISVPSLRLDVVIAQACHLSRASAQATITAGRVSINHVSAVQPDEAVESGDTLSVRGFGRVRIYDQAGVSKKGRIRLAVGILEAHL